MACHIVPSRKVCIRRVGRGMGARAPAILAGHRSQCPEAPENRPPTAQAHPGGGLTGGHPKSVVFVPGEGAAARRARRARRPDAPRRVRHRVEDARAEFRRADRPVAGGRGGAPRAGACAVRCCRAGSHKKLKK